MGLHAKHYKKMLKFHIAELKNLRMDAGAHPEGIEKKIFYGNFYSLYEKFINENCDIRQGLISVLF